jgi:hypothetical protein
MAEQQIDKNVTDASNPVQNIPVYRADMFRVVFGANLGDCITHMDDLVLDDVYALCPDTGRRRLALHTNPKGHFCIAKGSELGMPGAELYLDCTMSLMSREGRVIEVLILVELDQKNHIAASYLLALTPIDSKTDYTLLSMDRSAARRKFAQVACVSFTRGTHITLGSGAQKRIEDLQEGDRVLTRDDGTQAVRWIGQTTVRAAGDFAPIVITAGTLNNTNDLMVSADHRLFVYQRSDQIGVGRPELMVKARHLVNGETVYVQEGGFVDYFQILFDAHHIIYAEGIAAESMLIDPRTSPALPQELLDKLETILPGHGNGAMHGLDVQKALLDRPDAIDLLRRASIR